MQIVSYLSKSSFISLMQTATVSHDASQFQERTTLENGRLHKWEIENNNKILYCFLYCHWNSIQEKAYHINIEINMM